MNLKNCYSHVNLHTISNKNLVKHVTNGKDMM